MEFQAEPRGLPPAATGGEDAAGPRVEVRDAAAGLQIAASRDEGARDPRIEDKATEPQCGRGELLNPRWLVVDEPRDFVMPQDVLQQWAEPETFDGRRIQPRDELAAHPMARIGAGLVQRHWHSGPAQRQAQRQPRQAAADDFDGRRRNHRRTAIRW